MGSKQFEGTWSVLVPLPEVGNFNREFVKENVPESDQCKDPAVFKGRCVEDDPHITLLMGLPEDAEKVKQACECIKPFVAVICQSGRFQTKDKEFDDKQKHSYDVLWRNIACHGGEIEKLHGNLVKLFGVKWHFPEFKPHVTVAYLEYGTADKYFKILNENPQGVLVKEVILKKYQDKEAPIHRISLG